MYPSSFAAGEYLIYLPRNFIDVIDTHIRARRHFRLEITMKLQKAYNYLIAKYQSELLRLQDVCV